MCLKRLKVCFTSRSSTRLSKTQRCNIFTVCQAILFSFVWSLRTSCFNTSIKLTTILASGQMNYYYHMYKLVLIKQPSLSNQEHLKTVGRASSRHFVLSSQRENSLLLLHLQKLIRQGGGSCCVVGNRTVLPPHSRSASWFTSRLYTALTGDQKESSSLLY